MNTVRSKDGTTIAFEKTGEGPALLLVDGALCYREFGPSRPLAQQLAAHYTVFTYDRRGRGDSGDAATYSVQPEIEDIEALIEEAGAPYSSMGSPLAAHSSSMRRTASRASTSLRSTSRRSWSSPAATSCLRISCRGLRNW